MCVIVLYLCEFVGFTVWFTFLLMWVYLYFGFAYWHVLLLLLFFAGSIAGFCVCLFAICCCFGLVCYLGVVFRCCVSLLLVCYIDSVLLILIAGYFLVGVAYCFVALLNVRCFVVLLAFVVFWGVTLLFWLLIWCFGVLWWFLWGLYLWFVVFAFAYVDFGGVFDCFTFGVELLFELFL